MSLRISRLSLTGSKSYNFELDCLSAFGRVIDIVDLSGLMKEDGTRSKEIRVIVERRSGLSEMIVFNSDNPYIILHKREEEKE